MSDASLWTASAFIEATGGRPAGELPDAIGGVSIDTRTLEPGDAFFAIAGERFDGHDFASQAMRAGASVAVIAEDRAIPLGHLQLPKVVVGDVLRAMEALGRAARDRVAGKVAAVTGSVGKTTTKEMLRAALAPSGSVHAAVASFNNHWGVPLTLSRMPEDSAFGVFEIGMNHAGEIRTLVDMVRPDVAAITRIAPAHLGQFESVEGIARAKAEIFEGIVPGGTAVLNADDEHFDLLRSIATECGVRSIVTFGSAERADIRLIEAEGVQAVRVDGKDHPLQLQLAGRHNFANALCAIGVAQALGASIERAVEGLAAMEPVAGRGTRERLRHGEGEIVLLDESYNANPVSMEAGLAMLAELRPEPGGRRVAMLGDMRELGDHAAAMHASLAEAVMRSGAELVLLVGEEMAALAEPLEGRVELRHRPTVEAMEPVALAAIRAGDAVLVKASNGTGLGRFAATLRERAGQ